MIFPPPVKTQGILSIARRCVEWGLSSVLLAWMLCALATSGCAAQTAARPPSTGRIIGDIKLLGAHHVDSDELRDGLGISRAKELGQNFAAYMVALDRKRIESYYAGLGFFSATVGSTLSRVGKRVDVTFTISEGPRAKLVRVDVVGLPPDAGITAAELRNELPLADGDAFDYELYDLNRPKLVTALQNVGYATATVSGTVLADRQRAEVVLRLTVDTGPRSTFGEISLEGVEGVLADSVRARLRFRQGDRYSQRDIEDTRTDLYEYGRFQLVRIEPRPNDQGTVVPVHVTLGLGPPNDLRLGGGAGANSLSYEIRGQALYSRAGWPTPLTTTRLEFRPAAVLQRADQSSLEPRIDAIAGLDRADLVFPRVRGTAEAAFTYLALEAFTDYGPRLRLGVSTPLYRRVVHASLGWQLQLLRFADYEKLQDSDVQKYSLGDPDRLGFYEQSITVELRDNPLLPRRGLYAELRIEEGTSAAGGAFNYVRILPDLRGYLSVGPFTLAVRGRVGWFFAEADEVPVTQRFFAGGANSQRGFSERQLAPFLRQKDSEGGRAVAIGGAASVELSAELRFPLFEIRKLPIGGVLFTDAADVTEQAGDLALRHLHYASGAGLRAMTPIGSVRFDVGVRLNRRGPEEPSGSSRFAYHLSIGEAF